ncbi:MAG: hypothetical protein SZ59_C0002G0123 [candidate division TM6 bacterium GW2011_GWF2_28_16]|nr:MAG: hypothetical protein SZ59_C0002G0123 [candidate division TM6 bacterium GW2011_GWF2_28_16]
MKKLLSSLLLLSMFLNVYSMDKSYDSKMSKFLKEFTYSKIKSEKKAKEIFLKIVSGFWDGTLNLDGINGEFRNIENSDIKSVFVIAKILDSIIKMIKLNSELASQGLKDENFLSDFFAILKFYKDDMNIDPEYQYLLMQIKKSLIVDNIKIDFNENLYNAINALNKYLKQNTFAENYQIITITEEFANILNNIKRNMLSDVTKQLWKGFLVGAFNKLRSNGLSVDLCSGVNLEI